VRANVCEDFIDSISVFRTTEAQATRTFAHNIVDRYISPSADVKHEISEFRSVLRGCVPMRAMQSGRGQRTAASAEASGHGPQRPWD